jgi:hypothetical protein
MRTSVSMLVLFLCTPLTGRSTVVVIDPTAIAQQTGNEIVNLAKWAASEVHEASTALNTLNSYENSVLQLERMGDPKTLTAALPGVQNIATLTQIYQQANKDVSDWSAYTNPQSYKITAQQIEGIYGQPIWNGFTASNGVHVAPATGLINFNAANYNVMSGAQETIATLNQKKLSLTQQRDQAIAAMNAAGDQSTVQKYQAQITALNGAIENVDGQIQQEMHSAQLQVQQNEQGRQIYETTQAQQRQAQDYQDIDGALNFLPSGGSGGFRQPVYWGGSQP